MYRKILISLDSPERAVEVAEYGIKLARRVNAQVTLCRVVPAGAPLFGKKSGCVAGESREVRDDGGLLERMRRLLAGEGINLDTRVLEGNPVAAICREAREGQFDLVIMGEAESRLSRVRAGRIARHAPCPVLVVRR